MADEWFLKHGQDYYTLIPVKDPSNGLKLYALDDAQNLAPLEKDISKYIASWSLDLVNWSYHGTIVEDPEHDGKRFYAIPQNTDLAAGDYSRTVLTTEAKAKTVGAIMLSKITIDEVKIAEEIETISRGSD